MSAHAIVIRTNGRDDVLPIHFRDAARAERAAVRLRLEGHDARAVHVDDEACFVMVLTPRACALEGGA